MLMLNQNRIETLQNLPSSLKELHLYYNSVTAIHPKLRANNLIYLGLG